METAIAIVGPFVAYILQTVSSASTGSMATAASGLEAALPAIESLIPELVADVKAIIGSLKGGTTLTASDISTLQQLNAATDTYVASAIAQAQAGN